MSLYNNPVMSVSWVKSIYELSMSVSLVNIPVNELGMSDLLTALLMSSVCLSL